jgi:hypothetical protein
VVGADEVLDDRVGARAATCLDPRLADAVLVVGFHVLPATHLGGPFVKGRVAVRAPAREVPHRRRSAAEDVIDGVADLVEHDLREAIEVLLDELNSVLPVAPSRVFNRLAADSCWNLASS